MYFCIHDKLAIRTLIDGLRIPSLETRVGVIHLAIRIQSYRYLPGYHLGHVLRRFEYQTSGMASSIHSGTKVNQCVLP